MIWKHWYTKYICTNNTYVMNQLIVPNPRDTYYGCHNYFNRKSIALYFVPYHARLCLGRRTQQHTRNSASFRGLRIVSRRQSVNHTDRRAQTQSTSWVHRWKTIYRERDWAYTTIEVAKAKTAQRPIAFAGGFVGVVDANSNNRVVHSKKHGM